MPKVREFIQKLSNSQKIIGLISLLCFMVIVIVGIPTWARYKNRSTVNGVSEWDGSVAKSYRDGSGTEEDPYIISNGAELAYFQLQLLENDYENTYFKLSKDILLNKGLFKYDSENGLMYILNEQVYYVEEYSNRYYDNPERTGEEIGTVNLLGSLDGFKGHFDGGSFTIYGLYMTDENKDDLALFTNLKGSVRDLYVENAVIYGGSYTAGIASSASDTQLKNILFAGYVMGKGSNLTKTINVKLDEKVMDIKNIETIDYVFLKNRIPVIGGDVIYTNVTGEYEINGISEEEAIIKVNGEEVTGGKFEVSLGNYLSNLVSISTYTESTEVATITFKNLSYNIQYDYGIAAGIVGVANNITLENVVNKANIDSYSVSGGLVAVATDTVNIIQSYNRGKVVSNHVSGGLIGVIEKSDNPLAILNSYNTGDVEGVDYGGLLGIVSEALENITVQNVFDASATDYRIGTVDYSNVVVNNAYYIGGNIVKDGYVSGSFTLTTPEELMSKEFIQTNLLFNEFVNFENLKQYPQNVWVFENNNFPISFIDDIENPIAYVHVGRYSWNNFSNTLANLKFDSNITFAIKEANELIPAKEKYYYISNAVEPLTFEQVLTINSWAPYEDIVQITDEGHYVIYVKVVDYDDNVTYMNTDLLILDLPGTVASITTENYSWTTLKEDLNYIYINRPLTLSVIANDGVSSISSIKYHISDQVLSATDLDKLSGIDWQPYNGEIILDKVGKNVVYVQIIDNFDFVSYLNTDYIVYDGYVINDLFIGRNKSSYLEMAPFITNKSTITYNFTYSSNRVLNLEGHTHNLVTNVLLPQGTKITLIDNVKDKVYAYQVTTNEDLYNYYNSCPTEEVECENRATYPFTLFSRVGHISEKYVESSYDDNGVITENFTIILDLSKTNIYDNYYNVSINLELHDSEGNSVRPTLLNAMNNFNIYANNDASLLLTTDYPGTEIVYNSDSTTHINLTSIINYQEIDGIKIIDTRYEDKEIGLAIKLVDENNNIVGKEYLKNLVFKIDDQRYYPDKDNIIRVNLNSGIADITKTLTVISSDANANLKPGQYTLVINNYVSNDGHYYDEVGMAEITVPVIVLDNYVEYEYGFDVIMDDVNRIINKTEENTKVTFKILQNGMLSEPNIRVALYKKELLTAYDQTYSLIDLREYVTDNLDMASDEVYYVTTEPIQYDGSEETYNYFELNLITTNFENTGYKFVFSLYDGNKKIGTIEKYFIVR